MNFAFLASLAWLFSKPEKDSEIGLYPREKIVTGGIYIFQNEVDSSVLTASDPGDPNYTIGNVTTSKWRISSLTTWVVKTSTKFADDEIYTIRSQNNTSNEMALILSPSKENGRLDPLPRFWNLTFAGRTFGFDKWLVMDLGTDGVSTGQCLHNEKKGTRVVLRDCEKDNRSQRWRLCLCESPKNFLHP